MKKIIALCCCVFLINVLNLNAQTYNYYFGNIHAHSSYSDGNQDSTTSHITKPIQDFNYAKTAQHLDFYGISEHNHQSAGMTNPSHFHQGIADALAATTSSFVALYGMEWGVISGGGHVIVYGYDSLIGWDNNDYDVYVAQNDYANLWKKINEKPNSFAYLAHPASTDYSNLFTNPYDLSSDNAIVGLAARSGPATSTNNTYSNPSTSTYIARYNDALKRGYHLGVGLDHDTHNSVFGKQTAGRLVVLAPSLSRNDILDAVRHMRMYSSDDWNVKVNFSIKNNPMGSILSYTGTPILVANVTDPDASETVSSIAVYYGVPGSGSNPTVLTTVTNTANLSYTHNIANNSSYYYYLKITQNDGDIIWTSPIWYNRNDALTNTPPVTNFAMSSNTICAGQSVTLTDNTSNAPTTWNWTLTGALPSTSSQQHVIASYYNPGTYTLSLNTSNSFGNSNTVTQTITVVPLPNLTATQQTICAGQTASITANGAITYSWSTGQTSPSIVVTPSVSTLYSITGTSNGCSKTINTFVIVNTCTGIEAITEQPLAIFPNPASQFLNIDFKELVNEKTVYVYDTFGKLLYQQQTTDFNLKIPVSDFKAGMYILKVILDDKQMATQKFLIERE